MGKKFLIFVVAGLASVLFSISAFSQTYYGTRAEFQSSHPGLRFEDFNSAVIASDQLCAGPGPWDSTSAATCFEPGGLLEGATYSVQMDSSADLAAVGPGVPGTLFSSPSLGVNDPNDVLAIDFASPDNTAVAVDVDCNPVFVFTTFEFSIFGTGGLIASETWPCVGPGPTFLGFDAGEQVIRLEIATEGMGLIDNLEYTFGPPTPRPPRATFAVWKDFEDDNPAEVLVTLRCNTGLPLEQSAMITDQQAGESVAAPNAPFEGEPGVVFVVRDFETGELDCEITEAVPEGYRAQYRDDIESNFEHCGFEGVTHGFEHRCNITNTPQPVLLEVTKVWIDENPQFNSGYRAEVDWQCANTLNGDTSGILEFNGNPDTRTIAVLPSWDGSTACTLTETVIADGGVEADASDCVSVSVVLGGSASCTIYNTRLYQGIPLLGHHGLAILALVLLGAGVLTIRRLG